MSFRGYRKSETALVDQEQRRPGGPFRIAVGQEVRAEDLRVVVGLHPVGRAVAAADADFVDAAVMAIVVWPDNID